MRSSWSEPFSWLTSPPGQTENSVEIWVSIFYLFGNSICFASSQPTHQCWHECLLLAVEAPTAGVQRQFGDMVSLLKSISYNTSRAYVSTSEHPYRSLYDVTFCYLSAQISLSSTAWELPLDSYGIVFLCLFTWNYYVPLHAGHQTSTRHEKITLSDTVLD